MKRHNPVRLVLALTVLPATLEAQVLPYRDANLSIERRVRDLVTRMTLEEKFWQLYMSPGDLDNPTHDYTKGSFGLQISSPGDARGAAAARAHAQRINSIQRFFVERTRLGIPIIPFEEALHGFVREGATVFPQAIALAATWDTALVRRVAIAIARETRSRGVRQVLSPVVNIANDVRWGRVEETYGEDPVLSARMGASFVRAFEQNGVVTTPKHFVANVGEGGRDSYPIDMSARWLEEMHFPPFRAALQSGARSVMTSYNSVDGAPATQSRWLLTDKLKRDWGFRGFIISDAAATGGATVLHMTEPNTPVAAQHAFQAGLDVVFQSTWEQHRPYLDAFRRGLVPDSVINGAVARVLRAKFELGLFERPFVHENSAAFWNGHADHRALALEAARASIVLLENDDNVLPLSRTVRNLAVIGTDAREARLGGYSGPSHRVVSILDGVRAALDTIAQVRYAPGPGRVTRTHAIVPAEFLSSDSAGRWVAGLQGEYFDNNSLQGAPRLLRRDARVDFGWTLNSPARGIPYDWYSVRWTGRLTVPATAVRRIGMEGNDGYRLWLDGKLIIDNWKKQSYRTWLTEISLAPGSTHDLRIEYFESTGNARVKLIWDAGITNAAPARIDSAVALARLSDAAIVVAGIEEGEFRDRAFLSLPGHQEELIRAVAATGKPTIVVLIGGSAITMSRWLDDVDAVLLAWYPGEQGGTAIADVLLGAHNPSARLPITFPMSEGQLPLYYNHKPTGRGDDYLDATGQPLFPFGFGLSYTRFAYSDLIIEPASIPANGRASVRFNVKNTGPRAGAEVVQLYVRDVLASRARPVMELKGFQRVQLEPGQEQEIRLELNARELSFPDRDLRWIVEPGVWRIMIGASAKDIRLRGELVVRE